MLEELPLLKNQHDHCFSLLVDDTRSLIPSRKPSAGEQYRFHFDIGTCIGCKCCVVACNEQNGNPAHINWRRVGEIEGGTYPDTQRWHVSMGCNHCLEPACLIGCPVEAYTKDEPTGIVLHSADICIGCQYCTWNCSYGVPQFNEDRGVVGKCDMCHGRLAVGSAPACVNACPEGAISIELVDMLAWRVDHATADAPGMPSSDDSISTTRISMPGAAIPQLGRVDITRIQPEHAHLSLVFLLVLTQLSAGAFATFWLLEIMGAHLAPLAALLPLIIGIIALGAAPMHLGRPIHAYRAVKNWKRSWLSREVLALSMFAGAATAYAGALFLGLPMTSWLAAGAFGTGILGVMSSAKIYIVKARPAWNSAHTLADFFLTAAVLGPRILLATGSTAVDAVYVLAAVATMLQAANHLLHYYSMKTSLEYELQASAGLLDGALRDPFHARYFLLSLSLVTLFFSPVSSFVVALAAEALSRWLFFRSVVPKTVASTYLTPSGAA